MADENVADMVLVENVVEGQRDAAGNDDPGQMPSNLAPTSSRSALMFLRVNGTAQP